MIAKNGNGKQKNLGGRPRVLTPEKQDEVIRFVKAGCSRKLAARLVGCSHVTIADEAKRNEPFSTRLSEAEGNLLESQLNKITSSDDWKAAAWYLARKYPSEWAEVKKHAETDVQGKELTADKRRQAVDAILKERFGERVK